ncbi:hypothetical protein CR513_33140, partial [Mucuna pruriens]
MRGYLDHCRGRPKYPFRIHVSRRAKTTQRGVRILGSISKKHLCNLLERNLETLVLIPQIIDPTPQWPLAKLYTFRLTIHHKTINKDKIMVVVEQVQDVDEVEIVRQTLNTLILWSRILVKSDFDESKEDVPLKRCFESIYIWQHDLYIYYTIVVDVIFSSRESEHMYKFHGPSSYLEYMKNRKSVTYNLTTIHNYKFKN